MISGFLLKVLVSPPHKVCDTIFIMLIELLENFFFKKYLLSVFVHTGDGKSTASVFEMARTFFSFINYNSKCFNTLGIFRSF